MSNKMKVFDMKHIHSGYVVKFRNGKYALCMRVGTKFTKIFACVDEASQKIGARESVTFVYTSRYSIGDNRYKGYDPVRGMPACNTDLDVVAVYGLLEGVSNYLNIGDIDPISIKNRPLLWEEEVKEMTLEEIEKKLGHRVKVVTNEKKAPIKGSGANGCCDKCRWSVGHSDCRAYRRCSDGCPHRGENGKCKCLTITLGDPCPYFEEETK